MLNPISFSSSKTFLLIVMSASIFQAQASLSDLDWDGLASKLSSSSALVDASTAKYIEECTETFLNTPIGELSQHDLVAKPSGLCMHFAVCGYKMCSPSNATTYGEFLEFNGIPGQPAPQEAIDVLLDPNNYRFNVPFKVVQPVTVSDIVEAVNFAAENGVELSVKNSGHNYAGASTKKDTILIHTPSLPKFSATSLEECTPEDGDISADLDNQACKLALARNCPATIRVGGGENFGEFYTAVKTFNDNAGVYKYHPVGGAAATVTPMGWTWQGGLGGTQMGRTFGFGADQVLQLEMVLADGSHVKFGPTEWEDADGYRYPKTTKVSGVCNSNPFTDDESEYVWEACANDINFDDLWFAVRGGGGGTWGIVVSTHLQLQTYPGTVAEIEISTEDFINFCNSTEPTCLPTFSKLTTVWHRFFLDIMLDPDSVTGVTAEQGLKCGKPAGSVFFCFGDAVEAVMSAWTTRVNEQRSVMINEMGLPEALVDWAAANMTTATIQADYLTVILYPEGHRLAGLGMDSPPPTWNQYTGGLLPVLIPKQKALDIIEDLAALDYSTFVDALYFAHADGTSDQANSLSQPHRDAAFMIFAEDTDPKYFELIFGGTDFVGGDFPGLFGSNHLSADAAGPIKSDWTKPCPANWTWEERAEKCFSPQEAIYGTQRLKRLQEIKAKVDPKGLFNCQNCISSPPDIGSGSDAHVIRNVATLGTIMVTLLLTMT